MTVRRTQRDDLVYAELHYKVAGILFEVFRELGAGFKESYYEKAVAVLLRKYGIAFRRQVPIQLMFQEKRIGTNFLDFLIQEKLILELKKGDYFDRKTIEQANQYLKATGLKLALIAVFTSKGVRIKRLVNI